MSRLFKYPSLWVTFIAWFAIVTLIPLVWGQQVLADDMTWSQFFGIHTPIAILLALLVRTVSAVLAQLVETTK